jgi:hypothetical protein
MSDDLVFRTKQAPAVVEPMKPIQKGAEPLSDSEIEPPYLDYEREKHQPYLVDYFNLGEYWQDKVGGFEKEIGTINNYIKDEIEQGRLDNSVEAVNAALKKIEKLAGFDKTERTTIKIAQMAAFTEFLYKTRDIKQNQYKYGNK